VGAIRLSKNKNNRPSILAVALMVMGLSFVAGVMLFPIDFHYGGPYYPLGGLLLYALGEIVLGTCVTCPIFGWALILPLLWWLYAPRKTKHD
jgi:hypothetical protein